MAVTGAKGWRRSWPDARVNTVNTGCHVTRSKKSKAGGSVTSVTPSLSRDTAAEGVTAARQGGPSALRAAVVR
jgi:hypothetical protein